MSPRGRAIPDVERRLFDAAERVLAEHGPGGLSSRAITSEAGTAAGLLFSHFPDLDAFLAAFVHDRFQRVHEAIGDLPQRAGTGTVAGNLTAAAVAVVPTASVLIDLVHARPSIAARLHDAGHSHAGGLDAIRHAFGAYLEAEGRAGRVSTDTDTDAIALALASSVHQLSWSHRPGDPELARAVGRVVVALVAGITSSRDR